MKPYPLPSCSGPCQQGKAPCRTEARCTLEMHRTLPSQVMDREYQITLIDEVRDWVRAGWIAFAGLVVVVALVSAGVMIWHGFGHFSIFY